MALLGGPTSHEKEFIELLEARGDSYMKLVSKHRVVPVENVHYISTSKDNFLISDDDMMRLLNLWNSCYRSGK